VIYGLGTALGWGIADFLAAIVSRRIGAVGALLLAQFAGLAGLALVLVFGHPSLDVSAGQLALLVGNGMIAAIAYIALYQGLELGPIALVSPIVAGYAAFTILLAVLFLHETLGGLVFVGAIVTLGGVMLASTDLRALFSRADTPANGGKSGIRFALVSMLAFGASTFLISRLARELGWFLPIATSRIATTTTLLAGSAIARQGPFRSIDAPSLVGAVVIGLGDVGGLILYARGSQLGFVSIVAAASAAYAVIPVVGGVLIFRERPAASQGLGIALVFAGLLLLGVGQ
jgi:drug/metabolite transporter (DMT)-like permease